MAVSGYGDGDGFHVQVARESGGFEWSDVAVLDPGGLDESAWYGYECVSGDGKFAAVTVLPGSLVNVDEARDRGAYAYVVDLASGAARAVLSGVSFQYSSPGCGTGDSAVFTASVDDTQAVTSVATVDLASGKVTSRAVVAGQVTSAVPAGSRVVGVAGDAVVSFGAGGTAAKPAGPRVESVVDGQAYDLHPAASGGADFLVNKTGSASASVAHWSGVKGAKAAVGGTGALSRLTLAGGRGGNNTVVGLSSSLTDGRLRAVRQALKLTQPAAVVSLDGDAVFAPASTDKDTSGSQPLTQVESTATQDVLSAGQTSRGSPRPAVTATSTQAPAGIDLASPLTRAPQPQISDRADPAPAATPSTPSPSTSSASATATPSSFLSAGTAGAPTTTSAAAQTSVGGGTVAAVQGAAATTQAPKCGVARLDPTLQALQPSPAQADWAVQMAEQGLLTGSAYTRPANFANMGLVAYAPNSDFSKIALDHPSSDTWDSVPRSVMEAIMAQESNYDQASWHALPGIAGDPLIGDYYGAKGSIDTIDYANADCGYGITQLTTGMAASETSITQHGKMKVAVDYQENIVAGLQVLEKTWNELYAAGITVNGGDPKYLENWYLAIWAYNSGIQPTAAYGNTTGCTPSATCAGPDGTWGLGWSNNPVNPSYPPGRAPYLQATYADAAHPADWPYQERVMGWMASPIIRLSQPAYDTPTYHGGSTWIQLPARDAFCTSANDCDVDYVDPTDASHTICQLGDYECWWHSPVTFVADCASTCATSSYQYTTGSSEPTYASPHPPTCNLDAAKVPTTSHGAPIVVDDIPDPADNRQGCASMNWSTNGTFAMTYGTDSAGDPVGQIDTHQLGAGFGGHIFFTHTQPTSATDLIDTGTWTPNLPSLQYYTIKLHLPATGATATNVVYEIHPGGGAAPWKIRVNQDWGSEQWVTIGTFAMQDGGYVTLSNASDAVANGTANYASYDVAFDAVAFLPQGGTPGTPIGGPPGIKDAPKGSNPAWVNCGCVQRTAGDPVSTSTGYFGDTFTDLATPGRAGGLAVTRSYASAVADPDGPNGADAVDGAFGPGWTFNDAMTATTDTTTGAVTITQEDASQVTFTDDSGTYTPTAPRFDATLTKSGTTYTYVRKGTAFFTFDTATGHLTAITDLAGTKASPTYATALTYDTSGDLHTVTDPNGHVDTFTWTGGHITKVTDTAGREVDYTYDTAGDLTDVYGVNTVRTGGTNGDQDHTQYTYDSSHLLTSMRSPANYAKTGTPAPVTSMVYDSSERVTSQTDPDGHTTTFAYGPDAGLATGQTLVTNPAGDKTLDTYTGGLLTSQTSAYGTSDAGTWSYTYDPITLGVTSMSDPDGHVTTSAYDDHGDVVSSSDARGLTTASTYSTSGALLSTVSPGGLETDYAYDEAGHVKTASGWNDGTTAYRLVTSAQTEPVNHDADIPDGNPPTATERTSSYYYDDAAHPADLTRTVDALGHTTTLTYTGAGQVASSTDPDGNPTKYAYDPDTGFQTAKVTPNGVAAGVTTTCTPPATGCSTATYDAAGDQLTATDPLGNTAITTYDADGNPVSVTDTLGNTTTTTYDPAGLPTTTKRADGSTQSVAYNADGTTKSTTDAAGNTTSYGYNHAGETTSTTDPDDRTTTSSYDPAGLLTSVTDPAGRTTTMTYDPDGRVATTAYSDGTTPDVSFGYDADGNKVTATDGTGTSTWAYDAFGELVKQTDGTGATMAYGYDAAGRQTADAYPGGAGTVTRGFDPAGLITTITDPASNATTFAYDPDGNLTGTTYPNGTTATVAFDHDDQVTSSTLASGTATLAQLDYTRDDAGQLTGQDATGISGGSTTYAYNQLNQVASTSAGATTGYTYDAADNPTTIGDTHQVFDQANQLCWTTAGTAPSNPDCDSPATGATIYTYNAGGQRTATTPATGQATSYTYDQTGRLTTVQSGATTHAYTYDADGLRTTTTDGTSTTHYTWDAASQLLSDGPAEYIYGPDGLPLEDITGTTPRWYFHDQLGSTRVLTNTTGTITATYTYDTYGHVTNHTGATTPLQYTGQQTDTTGLVYLHARYYDPSTTQFLTVDPLYTISGSRYGYVDANPLNDADPTGLCGWICKASIAAAAVVGTVALCLTVAGCPEAVAGDGLLAVVLVDGATEEAGGAVVTSSTAGRVIGAAAGGTITGLSGAMAMADSSGQKSAASDDSSEASNSGCGSGKTGNDTEPPAFRSDTSHIFRADRGHLSEDNPENRALIESAIKPENALAPKYLRGGGVLYRYAEELPDGNEVWAEVRNGEITNGGLNVKP